MKKKKSTRNTSELSKPYAKSSDSDQSSHLVNKSETNTHPNDEPGVSKPQGTLYIIATPIGNASDISLRALDILGQVNVLACEDTRVTSKLLARHGIKIPLITYHEHNGEKIRPLIIKRLKKGENVALVSDAGTPLISDPGYKLVRECADFGLNLTTLPGASAVMASLVLSGLPTDRFMFVGFLPSKQGQQRTELSELTTIPATLVFMENPRRLAATLSNMHDILGNREVAVSREITKLYEETRRGKLGDLADAYKSEGPPKGEAMIVVAPPTKAATTDEATLDDMLQEALTQSSLRDAVKEITQTTKLPRHKVYQRALEILESGKNDKVE
ncbi:MAG: 16S rRNA (cytidine(1402)-2'-O)-methyltransferase [Rhodospirillales bacterium]|jgi:16S rRNA (cytidine1402-2'-O)-methyltransferase|nr:16S rRNA (cytidine(1402)-2'-O)-methyltransferase [Rhodospirillales bacterium]